MKAIRFVCSAFLCLVGVLPMQARENDAVDAKAIVLNHIRDAYEWHIASWGDTEWTLSLPVIVHSPSTGWHCFSSARLLHSEGASYQGFRIATDGAYEGKIVEQTTDGQLIRPFDISITKTVLSLFINSFITVDMVLYTSRWYNRTSAQSPSPKGFVGFMEWLVTMLENEVVKPCIGREYKKYSPYLLSAFFFILTNNLMGLVPIFPGGGNVTGNIAITLVLALCTFFAVNAFATKEYWKEIFWPDVPLWLKCPVPLIPAIEFFGILTKPFALMIRLFANIMAGHSILLALTSIIFITAGMGLFIHASLSVVSVLFSVFMYAIEVLVAFIQAYVFTMLSAVFIGLSKVEKHSPC